MAHLVCGNFPEGEAHFRWVVERLKGDLATGRFGSTVLLSVFARAYSAFGLTQLGELAAAHRLGMEAVGIAGAADHPLSLATACWGLAHVELARGDLAAATSILERGLELVRRYALVLYRAVLCAELGRAYGFGGRSAEAAPLLAEAVALRDAHEWGSAFGLPYQAEFLLHSGDLGSACDPAKRGLELCRTAKYRSQEAFTLRLPGEIAAHHDPPDAETADDHYRQARMLAEALGTRHKREPLAAFRFYIR
jgi:hypothetical protein